MAGIYLHVPFCHAKCAYCDFYSIARTGLVADYATAVIHEYATRKGELADEPVTTLYFGGGTPSILPQDIFEDLSKALLCDTVEEFTIEVNPEDVSKGNIAFWKNAGVNRISIGVQSLVDNELKAVNRRHTASDALSAIQSIRNEGIHNISADLIYGLPGQHLASWEYSVDSLLDSGISHLSAYCLSYEPGTLLTRRRDKGDITEASDDTIAAMYEYLCKAASQKGFTHYEISNFALPDKESRHNSSYWHGVPYLGLGPGAHSLSADSVRRYNPSDIKKYIQQTGIVAEVDDETETDSINDKIMVGLRTQSGIDLSTIPEPYHPGILKESRRWLEAGHILLENHTLRIPESSWLLSDAIIRDLFV